MVRDSQDRKYFANSLTIWVNAPHRVIEESLKEMLASHMYNVAAEPFEADIGLSDLCYFSPPYPAPENVPTLALIKGKGDDLAAILRAGYQGYIDFDATPLILFKALQVVADGGIWAERKIIRKYMEAPKDPKLTQREREVQMLLLEGLSNPSIAEKLGISVSTVKAHVTSILAKFGAKTRIELIVKHKSEQK